MKKTQFIAKGITLIFLFSLFSTGKARATDYFFYVQLSDKKKSPYSISKPSDYLSERAIARRAYYHIPIDETDIPINPLYIKQIIDNGTLVHATSKWLNGVTIVVQDTTTIIQNIRTLDFVDFVQYTGLKNQSKKQNSQQNAAPQLLDFNYGSAAYQLDFMNGRELHQKGYNGEGMQVAIIDAGFSGVNTNKAFDIMRAEGRLLGTKDFVNPKSNIYTEHIHGANVLATMGAELDGIFVGTAPKASYWLLRSEADPGEYLFEPDLWVSAIEFADSVGVDVATTSLGYTTFDDRNMNYTYETLDGKTARASIAANMAYKKGILLLNSAGNDGNKSWKHIGVPADAEKVITVGALNNDSTLSSFSSIGLSTNQNIKPELAVQGRAIKTLSSNGSIISANGTSFSTPILAGAATCFLQAAKTLSPSHTLDEIRSSIFQSAHHYENPDFLMGYGIPDFKKAMTFFKFNSLNEIQARNFNKNKAFKIFVNKHSQNINLNLSLVQTNTPHKALIYQLDGRLVQQNIFLANKLSLDLSNLTEGIYIVKIED